MRIVGIDVSTRAIDFVSIPLERGLAQWHHYRLVGEDAFDRTRSIPLALPGAHSAYWDDVLAIGIEDPRGHSAGAIYRAQGAVLACLPPHTLVHPLIPSSWRKGSGLSGNATKEQITLMSTQMLRTEQEMTCDDWTQDAHDAHMIARATRNLITQPA